MAFMPLIIWAIQSAFIGGMAWIANTLITGNDKVENIITIVAVAIIGLLFFFALFMAVQVSKVNTRTNSALSRRSNWP